MSENGLSAIINSGRHSLVSLDGMNSRQNVENACWFRGNEMALPDILAKAAHQRAGIEQTMQHRNVEYDVAGRSAWPVAMDNLSKDRAYSYFGDAKDRSREAAVEACLSEINNGLERSRRRCTKRLLDNSVEHMARTERNSNDRNGACGGTGPLP